MIRLEANGITLDFAPDGGHLRQFTVRDDGLSIAPLHRAPWVGTEEALPEDTPAFMNWLGGDFFCAPFAAEENGSGLHGWPANAAWQVTVQTASSVTAELVPRVQGAQVEKTLQLRDGHPFVYQTHRFSGGTGHVTASNHANVSVPNGALISTSRKRWWETPGTPQESDPAMGRSILTYPARSEDPTRFPGVSGDVDVSRYPWGPANEDFVMGLEAAPGLGWTAVVRPEEGDAYLSLRNPVELPMTMLWHSNGGRDYAPWLGRHFGCLGVEEGAAATFLGLSSQQDLVGQGDVALGGTASLRHAIGAIAWPNRSQISDVRLEGNELVVSDQSAATRRIPFDGAFLA